VVPLDPTTLVAPGGAVPGATNPALPAPGGL